MDKQKGQKEYVRLRLKLASDKIKAAKLLFKNSQYRDAVSRAYYSIYYAAKALLLSHGQDPHTHKGVDILFRKFCATHQRPEINFAKMISVAREMRLNADYKEKVVIAKEDAQEAIDMAQSFLKEIRRLIK
jgi:hypothetical protein